ncbi:heavy-metal-associated domain-containing protein [Echinicola jeungdonensis]|uniref:Heavy-metal-associated domain-containing protein n=1 Tax=Echinicola jeungdonensis TaxID=709343 RepID=A0ABV5J8X7_9BACT|nr:heavy-metal-associated domain-containing protein [Echinicola jeungdonensis]MDN3670211.1 heavy-metal-associated domain-containing protein [Echinicola jeungdonensis]
MMLKKILIGACVVLFLLVGTLAVHIYLETKDQSLGPNWAMSQVDFNADLDSLKGESIKKELLEWEGMRDTRINRTSDYLIVLYDRKKQDPNDIVKKVNADYNLQSTLFHPSDAQLDGSCPAINKNSVTYQLGSFFRKIFKN